MLVTTTLPNMKTPNSKQVDPFTRGRIIGRHESGVSNRQIGRDLGLNYQTVNNIVNQWKTQGHCDVKKRCGRPRKTSPRQQRALKREILRDRRATILEVASGSGLSQYAVRKVLRECGYRRRVARKKPMISLINKLKRYKWAKKHQQEGMEFWKSVIWSDESKFCQFSNSARVYVWRTIGESWKSPCLQATVKHGGIGVMVWGAVWYEGRSSLIFVEDRLNGAKYNGILEDGLLPLYQDKLDKNTTLFQEDGAPCHTCRISKAWKNEHGIKTLEWVAQSPDLNPIEHVWEHLDRKIRARKVKAKSVADLK